MKCLFSPTRNVCEKQTDQHGMSEGQRKKSESPTGIAPFPWKLGKDNDVI